MGTMNLEQVRWHRQGAAGILPTSCRQCCSPLSLPARYLFSVVGTSRCDVRAACSGATPSNARVARIFVPPATTRAGTAQRSSSQNHWAVQFSPSPPSDGGEGRGEEEPFVQNSPLLGPLPIRSSWGEEE